MRNLCWISIFQIFLLSNLHSQPLTIDWQNCYAPREHNEGSSLLIDGNGYMLFNYITDSYPERSDWWLARTNNFGDTLWSTIFGGMEDDYPGQMKATPDGGFILSGTTFSWDIPGYHGSADYWLMKIDSLGNIQWQKCLGGSGYDFLTGIDLTSDSGYICIGYSRSINGEVIGNHGMDDFWVVWIDKNGNIKKGKCYGGSDDDQPYGVSVTSDGGAIVVGLTFSSDGDIHNNIHNGYPPLSEAWILKLDSAGQIQWEQCYGGTSYDGMKVVLPLADSDYFCAGETKSNDGQVTGNHGNEDFWVIKINHWGSLLWQKCYGGSKDEEPMCMKGSSDGNYIIAGYTYSNDSNVSGNHSMNDHYNDMWIIKITPAGELLWQQCIGGRGNEVCYDLLNQTNGKLLLLGYTNSDDNSGDVSCTFHSYAETDAWLVSLTDTTYTGINESDKKNQSITVYPVPANQFVRFDLTNLETGTENIILIMDGSGRIVERIKVRRVEKYVTWNTLNCVPGLYYYQLIGDNSIETGKIIIMK
jgi:hypothetical protein